MAPNRFVASLVLAGTTGLAMAGCGRPSRRCAPNSTPSASNDLAHAQLPLCNENRVAARLIVLAVEGLDDSSSHRIEAALADRYSEGLVAAVTAADSNLVTILARADSNINVAKTIAFLKELGIQTQEATEAEYQAAESALAVSTIDVPTSVASVDGDRPSKNQARSSTIVSLSTSLDPLRKRFNRDKGKLRFVAILSPT